LEHNLGRLDREIRNIATTRAKLPLSETNVQTRRVGGLKQKIRMMKDDLDSKFSESENL
jgi:hypothetical protein